MHDAQPGVDGEPVKLWIVGFVHEDGLRNLNPDGRLRVAAFVLSRSARAAAARVRSWLHGWLDFQDEPVLKWLYLCGVGECCQVGELVSLLAVLGQAQAERRCAIVGVDRVILDAYPLISQQSV